LPTKFTAEALCLRCKLDWHEAQTDAYRIP